MHHLLEYLEGLDTARESMLAQVIRWSEINSGTFHVGGLAELTDVLAQDFSVLGGEMEQLALPPLESTDLAGRSVIEPLGKAIRIRRWTQASRRAFLCIHMDTVYGAESPFRKCKTLDENRLNGPGVADAKGGLAIMLYALKALEDSPLAGQLGWEVIINPDEEIGSPGSASLLESAARAADFGMLFEPSLPDGGLISWRKGAGNFRFRTFGRAAHSGRDFQEGRNAIVALCRLMTAVHDLNRGDEVTLNVGRILGGGAVNIVPDRAEAWVNIRVVTPRQQREVLSQLESLVADYGQADGIQCELSGEFRSPPKPLDVDTARLQKQIEQCGAALGLEIKWRGSGGASDGNRLAGWGLPNIDSLGVCGGNIHSPDEFLLIDSLVPRAKLAALMLLRAAEESKNGANSQK